MPKGKTKGLNGESKILLARIEERLDFHMKDVKDELAELRKNNREDHGKIFAIIETNGKEIVKQSEWIKGHDGHHKIINARNGIFALIGGFFGSLGFNFFK